MLIRSPENAFWGSYIVCEKEKEKGEVWGSTYDERRNCTIVESKGEHTVAELADVLEITEMAIRRHLSNLEKDGLIYSKMVRQHVGRPTYLYGLSEKGEDTFPKEYKQFAIDMLEDLARMGDEKILRYVLKERTKRMEEQLQKRVSNQKNLAYKVQEIATMQEKTVIWFK